VNYRRRHAILAATVAVGIAAIPCTAFASSTPATDHALIKTSTIKKFSPGFKSGSSPASKSVRLHGSSAKGAVAPVTTPATPTTDPNPSLAVGLTYEQTSAYAILLDVNVTSASNVNYSSSINWGDGTTTTTGTAVSAGTQPETHTYAKVGVYTVTVTTTDQYSDQVQNAVQVATFGSDYTAFTPTRLLDTRSGIGAPAQPVAQNGTVKISTDGIFPEDVTAVVLNITVTNAHGTGFVTAYDDGDPNGIPTVSTVNYSAGQTVPNLAIVPVGQDNEIDLTNSGTLAGNIDLIADATGYFTQSASDGYTSLTPDRLVDTRNGTGAAKAQVQQNGTIAVQVAGADGGQLPSTGVDAVALNVTATDTGGNGFLTAYPDGLATLPNASNVNYSKGQTIANSVIVPVGGDGKIDITNSGGLAKGVDVVVDVVGYYSVNSASAYDVFSPQRLLDTRSPNWDGGPLENGDDGWFPLPLAVDSETDNLLSGVTGLVLNMTVTDTQGNGFLTVAPDPNSYDSYINGTFNEPTPPNSSSLNWTKGSTVPNMVQASAGNTGMIDVWNLGSPGGSADLIVDLFGEYQDN
jgi:hypothetical protein